MEQVSFFHNGRKVESDAVVIADSGVDVVLSLPGGKGGFGSMLRSIGAQIEKTTNREACRDLSGRRLRDVNEETRMRQYVQQQVRALRQLTYTSRGTRLRPVHFQHPLQIPNRLLKTYPAATGPRDPIFRSP